MGVKIRKKNDKWWVFINHNGKRKAKCVGDSKKAAEEVARKLEAKLTLGEFDISEKEEKLITFAEYARKWLEIYAKLHCKESTWRRYEGVLRNYLTPSFGNKCLNEITGRLPLELSYYINVATALVPGRIKRRINLRATSFILKE